MEKRTLYVSDLDGTLMRNDKTLSDYTVSTINRLVREGLAFTYATARSIQSSMEICGSLELKLPVISRNGTVLADNSTGEMLEKALFTSEEVALLRELLPETAKCGFVSRYVGNSMEKVCLKSDHVTGFQKYIDDHAGDKRMYFTDTKDEMFSGQVGYLTLIDDEEALRPAYERVKAYSGWECVFQKDAYDKEFWLEICPGNSTKAKALLKLKERYGFDRLVVFGDSVNDLPMFAAADESYAVSNALPEAKKAATGVIGSNEEDSVAGFLEKAYAVQ